MLLTHTIQLANDGRNPKLRNLTQALGAKMGSAKNMVPFWLADKEHIEPFCQWFFIRGVLPLNPRESVIVIEEVNETDWWDPKRTPMTFIGTYIHEGTEPSPEFQGITSFDDLCNIIREPMT